MIRYVSFGDLHYNINQNKITAVNESKNLPVRIKVNRTDLGGSKFVI